MIFKKNFYLLMLLINKQKNNFISKSRLERIALIYMLFKLYSISSNINIKNIHIINTGVNKVRVRVENIMSSNLFKILNKITFLF